MTSFREKTLHDLEWARIVQAVAVRCVGPRREMESTPFAGSFEAMRVALEETREATELLVAGEPLPLDGLRDVREHVRRAERSGALEGLQLNEIASVIACARVLRRFLGLRRKRAPRLELACGTDPTLDGLEEEIRSQVDADGTLSDRASPELRRLRSELADIRGRLVARLEEQIVRQAELLSDRFYTVREGRYVLPVRADAHDRVHGIVHGSSSSGATVYVEPRSNVVLGNRLKMAQAEMEREVARLLMLLSERVSEFAASLHAALDALDHADLRRAQALFGRDLRCTFPELSATPRIVLRAARHPNLALEGADVVANDLEIESGRAVVISGPNAGGKTVALKLLGLAALMARAGLPLPADEGSVCGFFAEVLTDVGDDQSIAKNLSTFSAHVTNLAEMLRVADARSLVLLDELAGGTDPEEGAALACAVVDALCRRGAALAVTTHYEPLKALAASDPRLRNASVGFDVERMLPTFRVMLDVPGASSALAVAARFGIPSDVIETARRVLPEQSRSFDAMVRKLEDQSRQLELARAGAEDARRGAETTRAQLEAERAQLTARDRAVLSKETEQLVELVRKARDEVRAARATLRDKKLEEQRLEEARQQVERAAQRLPDPLGPEPSAPPSAPIDVALLRVGARVHVPRLRADCEVVEPPSKGRVRVAAGPMKLWVGVDEVRAAGVGASPSARQDAPRPEAPARVSLPATDSNTLDLRGMRADDAVTLMETFLDRLYGASETVAYLLHGVGSGALRDAIRARLAEPSPYVSTSRPGTLEEGGERLTVVFLR